MRLVRTIIVAAVVLSAVTGTASAEYFVIDSYDLDIEVSSANRFFITETIDVTFSKPRHGIYRDIPARYYDRPVLIENISVPDQTFITQNNGQELRIRIGDADAYVDGRQRYVVSYEYQISKDPFDDRDELYFNLIGDGWDTTIDRVPVLVPLGAGQGDHHGSGVRSAGEPDTRRNRVRR